MPRSRTPSNASASSVDDPPSRTGGHISILAILCLGGCTTGSLSPIDRDFEGSLTADKPAHRRRVLTIDVLPDDVLLAIFDFYVFKFQYLDGFRQFIQSSTKRKIESWQSLVHVCRRWRGLVFGSPRGLNLHICYSSPSRSSTKSPEVWPALPIVISGGVREKESVDDVIALLEHSDRISQINLVCFRHIEKVCTAMEVPFPELAGLHLLQGDLSDGPVLPDSFLGGSAPRLRYFSLNGIPFPGLPNLLLSATHLVQLHLLNIPHSGYISPKAMATCLSVLTSLKELDLRFYSESPRSSPHQESRPPPPPTRFVLPALTKFWFSGVIEYLEDLVSRIDTPRLYSLWTGFSKDIDFKPPELNQFINRTPTLGPYNDSRLTMQWSKEISYA